MEIQQINIGRPSYNAFIPQCGDITCHSSCSCTKGLVWYSYRYKKFYCKCCHRTESGSDYLMSFETQSELVEHVKHVHKGNFGDFTIPAITDDILLQIDLANQSRANRGNN